MRAKTLTIYWHNKQPIYACDFQKSDGVTFSGGTSSNIGRFATAGADSCARLWRVNADESVKYLCTLQRHDAGVNCVRWCPNKPLLATAGDDGVIVVWKSSDQNADGSSRQVSSAFQQALGDADGDEEVEKWIPLCILLGPQRAAIFDLAWSPCGTYIASVSDIDNALRIWNFNEKKLVCQQVDHKHFVQGVSWSSDGLQIATQSSDRSVIVYSVKNNGKTLKLIVSLRSSRLEIPLIAENNQGSITENAPQTQENSAQSGEPSIQSIPKKTSNHVKLYQDENTSSFFRRLQYSPDCKILACPSGIYQDSSNSHSTVKCVYAYAAHNIKAGPVCCFNVGKKPAVAVRWSPVKYALNRNINNVIPPVFNLPYRMLLAVATHDAIIVFDTQQEVPLTLVKNLHYHHLTDLTWAPDGLSLLVASSDGFCSVIQFDQGELGDLYECNDVADQSASSMQTTVENALTPSEIGKQSIASSINILSVSKKAASDDCIIIE
ncbi:hypothetical protein MIR68_000337 [Amoeboaphelidium protococcarum]|nr:hypothetical protein MIR68_000337 [Amoeboaphelidium protococcarum]